MQSWVYKQGLEKGIAQGVEKGIAQGVEKGIAQGVEKGVEKEGLRLLERLLERRLGRPLTEPERGTLMRRFQTLGADRLGDAALELSAEALATWLNDPNAR